MPHASPARCLCLIAVLLSLPVPHTPAAPPHAKPSAPQMLLDFWASTCGSCRPALAAVQALHARYPGLRVLGVAMDDPDTATDVGPLLRQYGVTYPVRVASTTNLRLAQAYGLRVYPTLFLLDTHRPLHSDTAGEAVADGALGSPK